MCFYVAKLINKFKYSKKNNAYRRNFNANSRNFQHLYVFLFKK